MKKPTLHYDIAVKNTGAHLIDVQITIAQSDHDVIAKMPKWIPGSYKIRDYARHVQAFAAYDTDNHPLSWQKTDGDTWQIHSGNQPLTITYQIYAYDLSVRGAYLDDQRLFLNPCCVCLDIIHLSNQPRTITVTPPGPWPCFTQLIPHLIPNSPNPLGSSNQHVAADTTSKTYYAENHDLLIDSPIESAQHTMQQTVSVAQIPHHVVFTGRLLPDYDITRISASIAAICQAQIQLFNGTPLTNDYHFMTYIEPNLYGGLEHLHSTALMASPEMILRQDAPLDKPTIDFLGLCSHEYFHLWNIKRLRPTDYLHYDLYQPQHSEMLWLFEGFTSYYDEVFLRRANIIDEATFLDRQASNLSRVLATPGRHLQSLAESSFDAWTKLYQADNNSRNHMVSYYSKGAIFALYLDLWLRLHTQNQASLDDLMRWLWQHYGQDNRGIDEMDAMAGCKQLVSADKHTDLERLFNTGIHGTQDLPLADILTNFGIDYELSPGKTKNQVHTSEPGFRISKNSRHNIDITFLDSLSHAAQVGVSVDDEIIAINHQHIASLDTTAVLFTNQPGESIQLTLNRRGRLFEKHVILAPPAATQVTLKATQQTALGQAWLETTV